MQHTKSAKKPPQKSGLQNFSWKKVFSDWKAIIVIIVFVWSSFTLFQLDKQKDIKEWRELGNLPVFILKQEISKRIEKLPNVSKMDRYEKDEIRKQMLERAQSANSLQIIWQNKRWVLYTNLKLGLDLRGGSQLLLQALPAPPLVPIINSDIMKNVLVVIDNRINSLGVSETLVQLTGKDRLIVELPGIKDPQQAKDRIGTTALLEFKELAFADEGRTYWKDTGLTGAEFKHAQANPTVAGGIWRVSFEFKPEGASKFAALTQRLVNRQIGIFLDGQPTDRQPDGTPVPVDKYHGVTVKEPILGGTGEITGSFSRDQAVDLASKLNAGALPVPIKIIEERSVGATLGQDSIEKSLIAGIVGITMVMLFMILVYGLPGLVADCALILYTLFTLAIFKTIPVTLTLAGIAGFILSVGMAVDANILIFERTKEELKAGKSLYMAIENGFSRAFTSILDSNINSLIACTVLYSLGTAIVRGFAFTLAIGVVVSMFTAITATRTLLHLVPKYDGLFGQRNKVGGAK